MSIHHSEMSEVKKGSELVATGVRGIRNLTHGKTYTAVKPSMGGIFQDRPYVSVVDDTGAVSTWYLRRFSFPEDVS